jgi:hypothetical protein
MKGLALIAAFWLCTTAVASAGSSDRAPRFDRLDSNADGRLSRAETVAHSELAQKFEQLDVNKDGFLSRDELTAKRRSLCSFTEADDQAGKAQSHSPKRTAFVTE